jgi:hypothetical protein
VIRETYRPAPVRPSPSHDLKLKAGDSRTAETIEGSLFYFQQVSIATTIRGLSASADVPFETTVESQKLLRMRIRPRIIRIRHTSASNSSVILSRDGGVLRDRSLIVHSLSAITKFTKQNKINKNKMKVVKLETYNTTFGRLYVLV